jgi:succinoglycan biosynthesis protein ExoL
VDLPIELVENKHLELDPVEDEPSLPAGPPWRVGWFGTLRCRRSLHMLGLLAESTEGRFEVELRGRPALDAMPDFHEKVAGTRHLAFHGAYRNPEEVATLYSAVHFSWVIDFYEEGQNSEWLLPNRLYEGCRFGAVPIARKGTETANFIERLGIGVVLQQPTDQGMLNALADLTEGEVATLRRNVAALPRETWSYGRADCSRLVARLARLGGAQAPFHAEPADTVNVVE